MMNKILAAILLTASGAGAQTIGTVPAPTDIAKRLHLPDDGVWETVCSELGISGPLPSLGPNLEADSESITCQGAAEAAKVCVCGTDLGICVYLFFHADENRWRFDGWAEIPRFHQVEELRLIRGADRPSFLQYRRGIPVGTGLGRCEDHWLLLEPSGSHEALEYGSASTCCGGACYCDRYAESLHRISFDRGTVKLEVDFEIRVETTWPDDPPVELFHATRTIRWTWDGTTRTFLPDPERTPEEGAWLRACAECWSCKALVHLNKEILLQLARTGTDAQLDGLRKILDGAGDSDEVGELRSALRRN